MNIVDLSTATGLDNISYFGGRVVSTCCHLGSGVVVTEICNKVCQSFTPESYSVIYGRPLNAYIDTKPSIKVFFTKKTTKMSHLTCFMVNFQKIQQNWGPSIPRVLLAMPFILLLEMLSVTRHSAACVLVMEISHSKAAG